MATETIEQFTHAVTELQQQVNLLHTFCQLHPYVPRPTFPHLTIGQVTWYEKLLVINGNIIPIASISPQEVDDTTKEILVKLIYTQALPWCKERMQSLQRLAWEYQQRNNWQHLLPILQYLAIKDAFL